MVSIKKQINEDLEERPPNHPSELDRREGQNILGGKGKELQ
jgi:hypothetical protein